MKLLQRLKNVFTNHLIDPKDVSDKINETLKELQSINKQEPVKETVYPFHIEWDRIGIPFSIERTTNDVGESITTIGYWSDPKYGVSSEPKEWFLFITKDQHETLVEEFKQWTLANLYYSDNGKKE